jgi:hypothetical protein
MPRVALVGSVLALALLALSLRQRPAGADGPDDVFVTNFPDLQRVVGTVTVAAPVPETRLVELGALASPGLRSDPSSYTEAGVLDATGFGSATVSLSGVVQGRLAQPGPVSVLLLPDVPEIVGIFRTYGIVQFGLRVEAEAPVTEPGVFQSTPTSFRLAFPQYRVLVLNGTPRTSEVTVYAYLGAD